MARLPIARKKQRSKKLRSATRKVSSNILWYDGLSMKKTSKLPNSVKGFETKPPTFTEADELVLARKITRAQVVSELGGKPADLVLHNFPQGDRIRPGFGYDMASGRILGPNDGTHKIGGIVGFLGNDGKQTHHAVYLFKK